MPKTCWVAGAGEFAPRGFAPRPGDFVVAADGGLRALEAIGARADLLLGDFDSLPNGLARADLPVARFPAEKDDTDTALAVQAGWERGYRAFALYGCGGGRVDHLLANIQLLCRYSRMGGEMRLVAGEYDLFAVTNGTLRLPPRPAGALVSVFCNGDTARGVTLEGLKYPLREATLFCDRALGVSNRYAGGADASVAVESGTLYALAYLRDER